MTRTLTTFQKTLIAAIVILLAAGAAARLYYSRAEYTRVKTVLKKEQMPEFLLMAHVKGAVNKPRLVTLKKGARVKDAVEAAGGFAHGARRDALNLAAYVKDGEEIDVPGGGGGAHAAGAEAAVQKLAPGQKIDINSANAEDFQKIPGIGPTYAARIVALRNQRGPFNDIEELRLVKGIGEGRFAKIKPFVTAAPK